MRSSLLTFATDLLDEGLETVADNVQQRGGAGGITLASAYHDARDVFPHNPNRVVYFQEPGAVFFQPTPERFRDDGEVVDETTAGFLRDFMQEFRDHVVRVLTVLPRP